MPSAFSLLAVPLLCCLLLAAPDRAALAHPHAFVEAFVTMVFDDQGLAGIHQRWVLDEMLTVTVLDLVNADNDGKLSRTEADAIERESFKNIKDFNYFTHIRIDGKPFAVQWARDFKASMDGRKLVYEFFVPCHVAASDQEREVAAAIFDDSFYTYVTYGEEGATSIDPTADPQFANSSAPARPDDFQRFAKSVRLGSYQGGVRMAGPTAGLTVHAKVREAPEMTYYFDQIVPEAMVVRFRRS